MYLKLLEKTFRGAKGECKFSAVWTHRPGKGVVSALLYMEKPTETLKLKPKRCLYSTPNRQNTVWLTYVYTSLSSYFAWVWNCRHGNTLPSLTAGKRFDFQSTCHSHDKARSLRVTCHVFVLLVVRRALLMQHVPLSFCPYLVSTRLQ